MSLPPGYQDPFYKDSPMAPNPMAERQAEADRAPAMDTLTLDSRPGTWAHIAEVRRLVGLVLRGLAQRALLHDRSKLESPEVEHFDRAAFRLAGCEYGSEEYRSGLADLKPALDHHYAVNSHHPEHYPEGIRGMDLLDILEMVCDWAAAVQRSPGGDLRRSIEINQARFGYTDEMKQVLLNTVPFLEDRS